jgi:putative ATP-dependent endonuclease of OLD family
MLIRQVRVRNLRSVREETLECDSLTALVGRNGAGKSTFLRALELFYASSPKAELHDFYNRDPSSPIEISVTFGAIQEAALQKFRRYVEGGSLTVDCIIRSIDGKPTPTLHGASLQSADFLPFREADSASAKREAYNALRSQSAYEGLPVWKNQSQALEALEAWESNHIDALVRLRDDGHFFGFVPVARGYLGKFTRLLSVQAVRDASADAADRKGAALTELMDLVVRSVIARRGTVGQLERETQERYEEIIKPENLPELPDLQNRLTRTLQTYVPDAEVRLDWQKPDEVSLPLPRSEVRLVEDGFEANVDRTGHGLQRAFLITLLQHLTMAQAELPAGPPGPSGTSVEPAEDLPDLVLLLEEPELYQHPTRQRHLASILMRLANGTLPGVARRSQVIYTTHSPFFVGIDRIDQIRLLRKVPGDAGAPKITSVMSTTLERAAAFLWQASGARGPRFTAESLRPRLQAVMTPWINEGFFADTALLVEGEDDRAALFGGAQLRGVNLDSVGVSVIPCGGKNSLDRPAVIFGQLGIRTYLVWDSDRGNARADPEVNRRLLLIVGAAPEDWPLGVFERHACLEGNLEKTLQLELGGTVYEASMAQAQVEYAFADRDRAVKNATVVGRALEIAGAQGARSHTLDAILDRVLETRTLRRA